MHMRIKLDAHSSSRVEGSWDPGLYYDNIHPVVHGLAISASRISKVIRLIIYTIYDWNTPNIRDDSFVQKHYLVSTSLISNKRSFNTQ